MTDAKTKKSRAVAAHPKYITMVNEAIVTLKERGGSSRPAILKYIKSTYKVGDNPTIINNSIKRALKSGVTDKTLIQTKGVGASGSFKVAKAETKPKAAAKKPAKKVVKPKAVTKKPKKAVKPKKAAKSPKKAAKSPKKAAKSPKKAAKSPKKVAKPKKKAVTPKKTIKPKKPAAKKVVNPKKPTAKKPAKK